MKHAKVIDGELIKFPYHMQDLRKDNINISFPVDTRISDYVGQFDVVEVDEVPQPTGVDIATRGPVSFSEGRWTETWTTRDYTEEERSQVLTGAIKDKQKEIVKDFEDSLTALSGAYPDKERESWAQQEKEALEYSNDNTASVPLLENMALTRNLSVEVMSNKIINNSVLWKELYGKALGLKQYREDQLIAIDLTLPNAFDLINEV